MKKIVESIAPRQLLGAYLEAREQFQTADIVLVGHREGNEDGFAAAPRSVYVETAFVRWNEMQRAAHPLARESAQKKLQMPMDALAFWLVIEMPEEGAIASCAIGTYLHKTEAELS
jgi:hypothetical protein